MNEIEKMYENAGLLITACHITYDDRSTCNSLYPAFTAKKQIELIKWLIASGECYFAITIKPDEFDEDLAKYINRMWCDLTEEERNQIKDILK